MLLFSPVHFGAATLPQSMFISWCVFAMQGSVLHA